MPPVSRSRSTTLMALALLLLSLPCLVLGGWLLDARARIALECTPAGACVLRRGGWLTQEVAARFEVAAVQAVAVERGRAGRGGARSLYRPLLTLPEGRFALAYRWAPSPEGPAATVARLEAFRAAPGGQGLVLVHDERRGAALGGGVFAALGLGLLALGVRLGVGRARSARATEARTRPTTPGARRG